MSTISVRDLIARIRKGRPENGYLFSGRDRDRKEETIVAVEDALRAAGDGTLSVIRVRSGETTAEEFAAHLFNISLFDSCRLVIVPSADDLDGAARDILLEYARSPSVGVCLIACTRFGAREIGRRAPAVLGKLKGAMALVDFPPPRPDELRRRAAGLAEGLGFRIEEEAIDRLLAMAGEDPVAVRSEIEKLALFLPEGGTAGVAEVERVASRGGSVDVWALAEAIGRRDAELAQVVLQDLLRSGERPVQIVGALWYSLVRMAWCRELLDEGADEAEIGRRLKLQPWAARRYRAGAIRFTGEEYRRILGVLFELDVALRSGGREVRPVFSRGVAEMVVGGSPGRGSGGVR